MPSTPEFHPSVLQPAVEAIWLGSGEAAPQGHDLQRAIACLRGALAYGQTIPRTADKTFQPLAGPRNDIEEASYPQEEGTHLPTPTATA